MLYQEELTEKLIAGAIEVGLIINFHTRFIKDGIKRLVL
jgi:hypothetical protein